MGKKQDPKDVIEVNEISVNEIDSLPIDKEAIKITENLIAEKKKEMEGKVYSVRMNESLLTRLNQFIENHVEWNNKEALGVIEIHKTLKEIQKKGIKDGYVYMSSLPLQATHYFISKTKGVGLIHAKEHVELSKVFDEALERSSNDVKQIKDLERELAALQQGIKLE